MKKLLLLLILFVSFPIFSQHYTLTATKYYPGRGGLTWYTADGSRIEKDKLYNYELRWVALSHDMLKVFQYGDTILVDCENEYLKGLWIVKDKMHKRWKNRIDFMLPYGEKIGFDRPIKVKVEKYESKQKKTNY